MVLELVQVADDDTVIISYCLHEQPMLEYA